MSSLLLKQQQLEPQQLINALPSFMERIQKLLDVLEIDLTQYQADHIALRINDCEVAEAAHQAWLQQAEEWSNNEINGRPIIALGFNQALTSNGWSIECLELPYPGDKSYPQQGWEHVEWVIPCNVDSQEAFLDYVFKTFPILKGKWDNLASLGVKVKQSCPSGDAERIANYTIAFKYQGVCIKLHPHSLKAVIESEQA
ncbi:VOC family protein [Aliivibrio sp. S4TY2]|uniref:VOC family protein n=1 Tax=unclassified Aliivibrio TaxID=2645654 RepID=UPI0023799EAA|nr:MULTISPECIES: VOC family protein [unclassified Aliivibrio]MDD9156497.1 VOC family protein [Aliivibrio sp. S4TY2]MDD9160066.1 VOC family protein [Aliivibrio sp. S4TY1]MDD9164288.1 VOC family protein [Aliivibrio sp. S4MY2]MDD9168204.1 VOC family protein [Aliivibrio sp. S4MY4]MDD9184540.1 VOC family protein [Aliivibrio sp. S4MY3]